MRNSLKSTTKFLSWKFQNSSFLLCLLANEISVLVSGWQHSGLTNTGFYACLQLSATCWLSWPNWILLTSSSTCFLFSPLRPLHYLHSLASSVSHAIERRAGSPGKLRNNCQISSPTKSKSMSSFVKGHFQCQANFQYWVFSFWLEMPVTESVYFVTSLAFQDRFFP